MPPRKRVKKSVLKEWYGNLSTFWKTIIVGVASVGAVIGTYQQIQASIATKAEVKRVETCAMDEIKHLNSVHDTDVAEIAASFQNIQLRHEIRDVERQIKEKSYEYKKSPSEKTEEELGKLKIEKEELLRDLDANKDQRKQMKQQMGK